MGIGTVVAANGTWPREEIWKPLVEKADMLIALDGAGDRIQADLVLGDMDSISQIPNDKFLHLVEQDDTDLAKALKRFDVSHIFGVNGGRLDHHIGTFFALIESGSNAIVHFDKWCGVRIPKDGRTIKLNQGSIVSLFAFGKVEEIQSSGLAYGFDNQNLETGTRGIHNEAISDEVFVKCGNGELVMLWSIDSELEQK